LLANSTQLKNTAVNKNKTTTVITNANNSNFGAKDSQAKIEGLMGQKLTGPKISTIKK